MSSATCLPLDARLVTVLPDNKLMVVDGETDTGDTQEADNVTLHHRFNRVAS